MRLIPALSAIAALAFATAAAAQPVTASQISFSPEFQTNVEEELGTREGEYLRASVADAVNAALIRHGVRNAGAIDISILDADPNKPTMQQIADTPGLDYFYSSSLGSAELHATLRDANGAVIGEVSHRERDYDIDQYLGAASTWTTARHAINRFAEKIADAYVANGR